jgi:hypothetical protein
MLERAMLRTKSLRDSHPSILARHSIFEENLEEIGSMLDNDNTKLSTPAHVVGGPERDSQAHLSLLVGAQSALPSDEEIHSNVATVSPPNNLHSCSRGDRCQKFRKQQRMIQRGQLTQQSQQDPQERCKEWMQQQAINAPAPTERANPSMEPATVLKQELQDFCSSLRKNDLLILQTQDLGAYDPDFLEELTAIMKWFSVLAAEERLLAILRVVEACVNVDMEEEVRDRRLQTLDALQRHSQPNAGENKDIWI